MIILISLMILTLLILLGNVGDLLTKTAFSCLLGHGSWTAKLHLLEFKNLVPDQARVVNGQQHLRRHRGHPRCQATQGFYTRYTVGNYTDYKVGQSGSRLSQGFPKRLISVSWKSAWPPWCKVQTAHRWPPNTKRKQRKRIGTAWALYGS